MADDLLCDTVQSAVTAACVDAYILTALCSLADRVLIVVDSAYVDESEIIEGEYKEVE